MYSAVSEHGAIKDYQKTKGADCNMQDLVTIRKKNHQVFWTIQIGKAPLYRSELWV